MRVLNTQEMAQVSGGLLNLKVGVHLGLGGKSYYGYKNEAGDYGHDKGHGGYKGHEGHKGHDGHKGYEGHKGHGGKGHGKYGY